MSDDLLLNVPLLRRRVPNLTVAARSAEGTFPAGGCPCGHPTCHPDHVSHDQPPPQAQP